MWGGVIYIGWHVIWQRPCEHIRGWQLPVVKEKETNDSKVISNLSKFHLDRLSISKELWRRGEGHGPMGASPNLPSVF